SRRTDLPPGGTHPRRSGGARLPLTEIDPVSVRIHGVTPSTFFFRHDLSGIPQPLHAPSHDAFFWSPSMSDRPPVLDPSPTDQTPRSPVRTPVPPTPAPPTDPPASDPTIRPPTPPAANERASRRARSSRRPTSSCC